ncbi:MAG TPA: phage portal protein [Chthoniobacteraceae bacterium]|nr:phage portal protein [Chthoniobacteraceae bacterium]
MKRQAPVINRSWLARTVDSAFEAFAPGLALKRASARDMLAYRAARITRARESAPRTSNHPDGPKTQRDRVTLMFEARDLADNVGFVKGHLRKVQLYGAGTLTYEPDTGDDGMDSEIREYLDWWYTLAHVGLDHHFNRLIQISLIGMTRDCDSMLVWYRDEDALRLQLIEADQVGELYSFSQRSDYVSGVYLNPDGTRAGYRVYERMGDMQYINPEFIPVENTLFFYDPMRSSKRGITAYDAAIENIRDKFEVLDFEKNAVKKLSTYDVVTYTERGRPEGFDYDKRVQDEGGASASLIRHAEAGATEFMGVGEKFEVINPNRPSSSFQGFLKMLDVESCANLNLPYGFLVDPSEPGGVAARIIAHVANREFERIQRDILLPKLNLIRDIVLGDAIERGDISRHANFRRGLWMFPPPPTADIQRESDIGIKEARAGLSTYTEQYAIYGQNRKRQWEIRKQEIIDKHRLAWEAQKALEEQGIPATISPEEIASMSDNPANNGQPAVDTDPFSK